MKTNVLCFALQVHLYIFHIPSFVQEPRTVIDTCWTWVNKMKNAMPKKVSKICKIDNENLGETMTAIFIILERYIQVLQNIAQVSRT